MQQPPSTRHPTPEVDPRAEEIRQSLNDNDRRWLVQCAIVASPLVFLSIASQLLNWNDGRFDPSKYLAEASSLDSLSREVTNTHAAPISELAQVDPHGRHPEPILFEEALRNAFNASLLSKFRTGKTIFFSCYRYRCYICSTSCN